MRPMLSCRDVTRLVLEGEERTLSLGERVGVRVHLWICKACPVFTRQTRLTRSAMDHWRAYRDAGEGLDEDLDKQKAGGDRR
ncbi:anti-sigma factor family protein [Leptothrix discophora]|uniref:Zf-HC2 domain-containing protein n=1 Tax=Leptothrix discophora TaxID=89 RepID=A0ABT9FYE4_LEPDI|nr:zf-HC2 domain-containing protein [Leptothrix discophora]MDP4299256.1 zf-HC2 domain-containing protein [Leptothrix discophora]